MQGVLAALTVLQIADVDCVWGRAWVEGALWWRSALGTACAKDH